MQLDQVMITVAGVGVTLGQLLAAVAMLLLVGVGVAWGRAVARARVRAGDPSMQRALLLVVETAVVLLALLGLGLALQIGGLLDFGALLSRVHGALNFPLAQVAGTSVTPISVLTFLLVLGLAFQGSRVLQGGLGRTLSARGMADPASIGIAQRLVHYLVVALGFALALNIVGIEISGLFAAGAVFAVGIGFAMQNIAQNFVSGLILLVERTIKPGDILEVEGKVLRVREMGIRTTVARTRDDEDILIPNSHLVQNAVKNYTLLDSTIRVRAAVGVHYDSDLKVVMASLTRAVHEVAGPEPLREPVVLLRGFGDSSVDFEVSMWTDDPWSVPRVRSALLLAVWEALKEDEVVIAYPQVDLHLDPPVQEAIQQLGRRSA